MLQFLHVCIDNICGRKSATYEDFKSVTNWEEEEYNILTAGIRELCLKTSNSDQVTCI